MKKVSQSLSIHLPSARLTVDDLKEIVSALATDDVSKSTLEVTVPGILFESLEEFEAKIQGTIHELKISRRDPYISIDFCNYSIWLYAANNDALSRGIFEQIKAIILSKRTFISYFLSNYSLFFFLVILSPVINFFIKSRLWSVILLVIGLLIFIAIQYFYKLRRFSTIVMSEPTPKPFWNSAKETILPKIIKYAVVIAITIIFTLIATNYFPELLQFLPKPK